uniref:Uncharacterized protein n=1 Tax=Anguilla anguilla TaxID=7936 RepID=A0A0E9SQC6_ANGAN
MSQKSIPFDRPEPAPQSKNNNPNLFVERTMSLTVSQICQLSCCTLYTLWLPV